MSKLLVSLCIIVLIAAGTAGGWYCRYQLFSYLPSTSEENLEHRVSGLYDKSGNLFSGRSRHDYNGGFSVYSYRNGILDGLNVVYVDGRRIKELGSWKDGKQHGLFELYTDKGVLVDHAFFANGVRDGETQQFWPDTGKLKVKAVYEAGRIEGMVEQYWPNGQLQFKHHYVHNVRDGICLDYFENGQLRSSVTFDKGVQNGSYKIFFENGSPQEEGTLKDGARNGPFTVYFPHSGKPFIKGNYVMNQYDGDITTWRSDGMKIVQTYRHGVPDGWQKIYRSNGKLMSEMMLKNGIADGMFRSYDSLGNRAQDGVNEGDVAPALPADESGITLKEVP